MPYPYTWAPQQVIPETAAQVSVVTRQGAPAALSTPVTVVGGLISFSLTNLGTYRIIVSSANQRETGTFVVDATGTDVSTPEFLMHEYTTNTSQSGQVLPPSPNYITQGQLDDPNSDVRGSLNTTILDLGDAKYAPVRATLFDDTSTAPNGTPAAFSSGQPLSLFGNAPLAISGGAYTHTTFAGANSAGYVQADMGPLTADHDGVYHIGADVSWPTSDISAVALVLSDEAWTDTPTPVRTVAKVHGVFYGNVMHVSTFNAPGETKYMDTSVASTDPAYVPKYTDVRGDASYRALDIQFDPLTGTVVVLRPDGSAVSKVVAALVGFKPRYAIWELYEPNGTGIQSAKFKNLRASVGPRPVGGAVPSKVDVGLLIAKASPQTFLLGSSIEYAPGTLDDIAIPTGTATAAKDGTLQVTYIVPSTGNVQIDLDGTIWAAVSTSIWWQLVRADTSGVVGNRRVQEAAGNGPVHATYRLAGDTPGAVRTLKWFHVAGATGPTLRCSSSEGRVANMRVTPLA